MKRLLTLVATLVVVGCGGGGGSSGGDSPANPSPTPQPGAVTRPMLYTGIFGTVDGQLAATAPFVNILHADDWGDSSTPAARELITERIIAQMQEARARGVKAFLLSTGYVTATGCNYTLGAELAQLKDRLDALDLTRSVVATYPIDEPDLRGCSDAQMRDIYHATKLVFDVPVAVVYGDHGTPGISEADWIGRDKYPNGPQLLPIGDHQLWIVISGGANPYREQPFAAVSIANPRIVLDWVFLYADYTDPRGFPQKGIGSNGMLATYCAAGKTITHTPGAC